MENTENESWTRHYETNRKWRRNHPDIYRLQKKRYYDKYDYGTGKLHKWTDEENKLVMAHSMPDKELAKKLQCSLRAVQVHRAYLKRKQARLK